MSVDELVELARRRFRRLTATRAAQATARGALIIDIRCARQQQRDGMVPGAIAIERNVLEWRVDPTESVARPSCGTVPRAADPHVRPGVSVEPGRSDPP
jgi:hypothetical protein